MPVKHLLALVFALAMSVGCGIHDPYTTEKAHFIVYNYFQYDEVEIYVDGASNIGATKKSVVPNIPTEFTVEVKVPKPANRDYYPTAPSSDDRTVSVSVNFRNVRTGVMTSALTCKAGAKVTTRVFIRQKTPTQVETGCDAL